MANRILYGDASRQGILRGVNGLANAVKVTLGPTAEAVISQIHREKDAPMLQGGM